MDKVRLFSIVITAVLLTACKMEIGNGDSDSSDNTTAQTVGGISRGVLTNASDLEINNDSDFSLSNTADITIDGVAAELTDLADGMVADIQLRANPGSQLASGTAFLVTVNHAAIGPITQLDPLQVLGINLLTTADTELVNITGDDPATLALNDTVKVSGYLDATYNTVVVTRLEKPTQTPSQWQVTGSISNLSSGISFSFGNQAVIQNGITVADCSGGASAGDVLQVTATADNSFTAGDDLTTVLTANCVNFALAIPENPQNDSVPAELEGVVESLESLSEVIVSGQRVIISGSETYTGGTANDLIPGARVEIEGTLDTLTSELQASRVKFHLPRVLLEAPATNSDIVAGESITLFGMTLQATLQTRDDDLILGTGIADQQINVRGFTDSEHTIYALRVQDAGTSDEDTVKLSGAVTRVNSSTFDILGTTIYTANADSIRNASGTSISATTLLNQLTKDSLVSVTQASRFSSDSLDEAAIKILEINTD